MLSIRTNNSAVTPAPYAAGSSSASAPGPRVSIGLPVYNGQRYLRNAIESILAQTLTDFELIICDNASTDQTQAICSAFAARDGRVRYYRNEKNLGAAPNFNKAFELATGKYFKWAAHDDMYAPDYLAACVAVLDGDPSAVLCHAKTIVIDENGDVIPAAPIGGENPRYIEVPRRLDSKQPHERFHDLLLSTRMCYEIFGLMRTESVARTPLHGSFYGSDKVMLSSLALAGRFVEVAQPLFYRRHHQQNSGAIKSVRARESWMNTQRKGKLMFPRLHCLAGYCRSLLGARLSPGERMRCAAVVGRYIAQPSRWVKAAREPW